MWLCSSNSQASKDHVPITIQCRALTLRNNMSRKTKDSFLPFENSNSYGSSRNSCYEFVSSGTRRYHWTDPIPGCKYATLSGCAHSFLKQTREHVQRQTSLVADLIAIWRHMISNVTSTLLRKGAVTEYKHKDICSLAISPLLQ